MYLGLLVDPEYTATQVQQAYEYPVSPPRAFQRDVRTKARLTGSQSGPDRPIRRFPAHQGAVRH